MSDCIPEKLSPEDKLVSKAGRPLSVKASTKKNEYGERLYKVMFTHWTDQSGWKYPASTMTKKLSAEELWEMGIRYKENDDAESTM